ncbi:MAG: NBR1-Ig-like domain-containing protein, partial [Anaerolineaceae bacterium]|nr:NBR1-Ig-like domain-containing protein [Anaerolineaceae bacterium]
MRSKRTHAISMVILVLLLVTLACGSMPTAKPTIAITFPTNNATLQQFQEVMVLSAVSAPVGIARVELYVNGTLTRSDTPAENNPSAAIVEQAWIPTQTGSTLLGVLAIDANGVTSDISEITVIVADNVDDVQPPPVVTQETPQNPQETELPCTNQAVFLEHVSIPVNAIMTPNWSFNKTWRVQNTGTCNWEGYDLIYISGDLLNATSPKSVPIVTAGSIADIGIDLLAPGISGSYSAIWRLRSAEGAIFGPDLYFQIIIPQPDTPTSTTTKTLVPTSTATKTPTTALPVYSEQVIAHTSIPSGTTGSQTVSCPTGSVVTSGGFALGDGLWFYNSTKNENGWRVYAKNNSATEQTLMVYALCLHNTGGTTTAILNQVNAAPSTWTRNFVLCPAGSTVVGGAFVNNSNGALELYNSSKSNNGWQIYVNNNTATQQLFNVYAICLSGAGGTTSDSYSSITIPAGTYAHG